MGRSLGGPQWAVDHGGSSVAFILVAIPENFYIIYHSVAARRVRELDGFVIAKGSILGGSENQFIQAVANSSRARCDLCDIRGLRWSRSILFPWIFLFFHFFLRLVRRVNQLGGWLFRWNDSRLYEGQYWTSLGVGSRSSYGFSVNQERSLGGPWWEANYGRRSICLLFAAILSCVFVAPFPKQFGELASYGNGCFHVATARFVARNRYFKSLSRDLYPQSVSQSFISPRVFYVPLFGSWAC